MAKKTTKKAPKPKKAPKTKKASKAPKAEKKRPKVDIANMTYQQIEKGLKEGTFTERELRGAYNRLRNIVNKAVMATQRTEYRFDNGEVPWFPLARDLASARDLIKAAADIGRTIRGHDYTPKQREKRFKSAFEKRRRALATRFGVGAVDITEEYVRNLGRFMKWYRSSIYQFLFDSDSDEVEYAVSHGASSKEWSAIFNSFVEARGYDVGGAMDEHGDNWNAFGYNSD